MPSLDLPPKPAGPQSLRRHGDFNKLWLGQGVSAFGSQVTVVALPLTAVVYLKASATRRRQPLLSAVLIRPASSAGQTGSVAESSSASVHQRQAAMPSAACMASTPWI